MKLAILAILLLALAAAVASSRESCRKEMSQQSINKCRSFVRSGTEQAEMLMGQDDDEDDTDTTSAPRMCCEQLRQVRQECRCDVIKHMMQQMAEEEEHHHGGKQGCGEQEMMMRAKFLPALCSMAPHTCKIRSSGSGSGSGSGNGGRIGMVV